MAQQQQPDPDAYTRPMGFTKTIHRDVYPAIDPKNPENNASGKSILITGGSRGIGKGIALSWATAGASAVVITGRNEEALRKASEEIKKASSNPHIKVLALPCEVIDQSATADLFSKVKKEIGKLDVLVCNVAALSHYEDNLKLGDKTPEDWWSDVEGNIKGTYLPIHYYLTTFTSNDANATGTIIITSSGAATVTIPGESSYCMSKAAMHRMVDSLTAEYPLIRAFSLNPGIVRAGTVPSAFLPFAHDTPELTGGMTLWLSGKRADFLKGRWVSVNWDVEEMQKHKDEVEEKELLKTKFLNVEWGPNGHPFQG